MNIKLPTAKGDRSKPRPCKNRSCSKTVRGTLYCEEHNYNTPEKRWNKKQTDPFYRSKCWLNKRQQKLAQQQLCEECEDKGIVKAVAFYDSDKKKWRTTVYNNGKLIEIKGVVDHIIPIKDGGQPLGIDNLQVLCTSCHASKTAKENHAPTN